MIVLPTDDGLRIALDAALNDRLSVVCGAGLSMASPSSIPSAAALAGAVKDEYEARYGTGRPALSDSIEEQAEFFFQADELQTVFLRTLVDSHAFDAPPNSGHYALGDLLLVKAVQAAVSTNVDQLIETAGTLLYGSVGVGISGSAVALLPPGVAPLLKLHGCWRIERDHTVWAPSQLLCEPVATRIADSTEWLRVNLRDRDLLVIGFFTDWDYLNTVLEKVLDDVRPARVLVVDPADPLDLAAKAPALYGLGTRATHEFGHVRESGSAFLESLWIDFSQSFVRRVAHAGLAEYEALTGAPPLATLTEPAHSEAHALWRLRRDLEGCRPNKPASLSAPPNEPLLGLTLLQLKAAGAVADGPYWSLHGQSVRVLRTPNKSLHSVEAMYAWDTAPVGAPEVVVAVGAEATCLPASVARGSPGGTITRGVSPKWYSRADAVGALGL